MSSDIASTSAWHRLVIEHRIKLSYALGAVALFFIRPSLESMLWGAPFILIGELIRLWASGHIHKFKEVTQTGPYALCRHPLYLGHFLIAIGFLIGSNQPIVAVAGIVLFWMIFIPTMQREEAQLSKMFGSRYTDYMKHTPRIIPRWSSKAWTGQFDTALMMQHREMNNIIGLATGMALFIVLGLLYGSW